MGNHNTQYFQTILLNNQSELKFMLRAKNVSEKAVICYTFTSWLGKEIAQEFSVNQNLSGLAKTETLLNAFCRSRDQREYQPFVFYRKRWPRRPMN